MYRVYLRRAWLIRSYISIKLTYSYYKTTKISGYLRPTYSVCNSHHLPLKSSVLASSSFQRYLDSLPRHSPGVLRPCTKSLAASCRLSLFHVVEASILRRERSPQEQKRWKTRVGEPTEGSGRGKLRAVLPQR